MSPEKGEGGAFAALLPKSIPRSLRLSAAFVCRSAEHVHNTPATVRSLAHQPTGFNELVLAKRRLKPEHGREKDSFSFSLFQILR